MRSSSVYSIACALVLSAAGGFGLADNAKSDDAVTRTTFVSHAAQAGMAEVELSRIALKQSQDQAVHKFANRMIVDHGKANTELAAIAQRKKLEVPKELDAKHRAMADKLGKLSGTEFDAAYAHHMATDHDKALALFQKGANLPDADLAGFAQKTLPTLKDHKRLADELSASKGGAAAAKHENY